jgi:hypothetical protein
MQRQDYLVGLRGSDLEHRELRIVTATSQEEAAEKFITSFAPGDETLLEMIADRSVSMSFASYFWLQTEEDKAWFRETAEVLVSKDEFERRVRQFFGVHADFANLYLDYYFSAEEAPQPPDFPAAMLVFIWKNTHFATPVMTLLTEIQRIA